MKTIPLTRGLFATVDDADYEDLIRHKWHAKPSGSGTFYACRAVYVDKLYSHTVVMHRYLCSGLSADAPFVDHRDGDGLNNQKHNLRACTKLENNRNAVRVRPGSSSRYKGVSWDASHNRWRAYIRIAKRLKYIGLFEDECDAATAYNFAAEAAFGEFASYNLPAII